MRNMVTPSWVEIERSVSLLRVGQVCNLPQTLSRQVENLPYELLRRLVFDLAFIGDFASVDGDGLAFLQTRTPAVVLPDDQAIVSGRRKLDVEFAVGVRDS